MFRSLIFVAICLSCLASLSLADLPPGYQQLTAAEKLNILWSKVTVEPYAMTSLPTKDPSAFDMAKLFGGKYDSVSFTQASDEMPKNREKLIHTYGSAAKVELKIFPNSTYTGIFKTGGVGIARLSVAKQDKTNFIPGMALKVLIDGQRSQNFQIMYSLDGQGANRNFFQNKFRNIVAESTSWALRLLEKAFTSAFEYLPGTDNDKPESAENLGLYEEASVTAQGEVVTDVKAPYVVIFTPNQAAGWSPSSTADFRVNLNAIPQGSLLYTVSVQRTATAPEEVIGQLVTTSGFVASAYEDGTLFFQHASKRWQA